MSAIPVPSHTNEKPQMYEWRSLYLNALFETDKTRLPARILSAERALMRRERELFAMASDTTERTIVNNALNALAALRRCIGLS
jgi:hypothetical protein